MNSLVGFKVGALGVDLVTARKVAMMCSPLFQLGVVSPSETIGVKSGLEISFSTYLLYLRVELAGGSPGMEGDKEEEEEEHGEKEEE